MFLLTGILPFPLVIKSPEIVKLFSDASDPGLIPELDNWSNPDISLACNLLVPFLPIYLVNEIIGLLPVLISKSPKSLGLS